MKASASSRVAIAVADDDYGGVIRSLADPVPKLEIIAIVRVLCQSIASVTTDAD